MAGFTYEKFRNLNVTDVEFVDVYRLVTDLIGRHDKLRLANELDVRISGVEEVIRRNGSMNVQVNGQNHIIDVHNADMHIREALISLMAILVAEYLEENTQNLYSLYRVPRGVIEHYANVIRRYERLGNQQSVDNQQGVDNQPEQLTEEPKKQPKSLRDYSLDGKKIIIRWYD